MNGSQNNKLDYPNYYSENNINQTRLANLDLINSYPTSSNLVDHLQHPQQPNQIASNPAQPQSSTSIPRYNSTPLIPNNTPNSKIHNPLNFVRNQPDTGTIEEGSTNSVNNINHLSYYQPNFSHIINAPSLQPQQPPPNSQYYHLPYMIFDPQTQSFRQAVLIPQFMPLVSNGNANNDDYLYQSQQPNFIGTFPPELYNNDIFSQNNNNNQQQQQQQQLYLDNSINNMYYDNDINGYPTENYIVGGNMVSGVDLEQIEMNKDDKDGGVNQLSQTKTQSLPSIHNESLDSDTGPSSDEDHGEDMLQELQNISFFRNIINVPVNNSNNKNVATSKTVNSTNVPNLPQATLLASTSSVVPPCQTCSINNNNDFSAAAEHSSVGSGSGTGTHSSSRFKKTRIKERTMIWNNDQLTVKDNLVTLLSELEIGRAKEWSVFNNLDQFELLHFGGFIADLDLNDDTLTKPTSPSRPNPEPMCIHETYLHKQLSPPPPPKNPPPPPPPAPSNISKSQLLQQLYSNSKCQNKSTSSLLPPKYQQQTPSISSPSTPFLNQQYHYRQRKSLQIPIPVYINQYHTQQHTIPIVSPVPQSHVPYLSNPVSSAHVNNNSNNILITDQHYKLTNPNSNLLNNTNKCCGSNNSVNKKRKRRWSVAGNLLDNSLGCLKAGLIDSHNASFLNFNNSQTPTQNQSSSHDSNNVHSITTPSDDWMQQNDLDFSTLGCPFNTYGNVNAASTPHHRSNFELKFDQQLMKLKKSIMSQFDQYLGDMRKEIRVLRSKNRELDLELRAHQRHLRNTTQKFYDQVPQSDLANYGLIENEGGLCSVDVGVGGTKDIDINIISAPTDVTNTVITTTCSTAEPH